jgi:hypothetical protein
MTRDGRVSVMPPCPNSLKVCEYHKSSNEVNGMSTSLFERTVDDDKPGLSVYDRAFLGIMDAHCKRNEKGNWVAP